MRPIPILVVLCMLLAVLAGPAAAQQQAGDAPPLSPAAQLDSAKSALDQVEGALGRTDVSDATLQKLRAEIDPVGLSLQAVVADLQPRADAAKARLAQLGPKPDPKAAVPEAPEITAERIGQEKLFNDLDASIKRARVLALQAGQLGDRIGALRRALFTRSVLARSSSLLDPRLWMPVVTELPADARALRFLGEDWFNGVAAKLAAWQWAVTATALLAIAAAYVPADRLARQLARRDAKLTGPSRLRRVAAGLWVAFVTAVVPLVAVGLVWVVLTGFDLIGARLEAIAGGVARAVAIVAVSVGLARGFLCPHRPNWRLPAISDNGAGRLYKLVIFVSVVVGLTRIVEALNDTISVGLPTAVATRGLLTAAAAAMMGLTLERLSFGDGASQARAVKKVGRDWSGPLRLLFAVLTAVLVLALLTGYVAFASFLVVQIVACTTIGILLYMLLILTDEGLNTGLAPGSLLGRATVQTFGLRREALDQIGILLGGGVRVVLIVMALLLVLAPWRIESGDLTSTLQAAFYGFNVGDVRISLSSIAVAAALFLVAMGVTRAVQRWLEVKYLPHTRLDTGLQNSIKTSFGYTGFLIAASLGLSQLGLSFERLAIVAGALSVGIGFGLQSIVNNFVSGLILLWERAVRVGDWIVVGDEQGYVRRINVRSTEIETFDRATVIVPNSNLVSGVVKNWLRNDRVGRIRLPFTLPVGMDPDRIREVLVAAAKEHDHILSIPSPQVIFSGLTDSTMKLELMCFIEDVEMSQRASSDILFAVFKGLREMGFGAPAPPPTVTSPTLDKLDAWLSGKLAEMPPRRSAANG